MSRNRGRGAGGFRAAASYEAPPPDLPLTHGTHIGHMRQEFSDCPCGGRRQFGTDAIGRSVVECVKCGARAPLSVNEPLKGMAP